MTKDQLRMYAAIAWAGIAGAQDIARSVRPQPGLELVLSRQESGLRLKAIQEERQLHQDDATVIAEAFGVPPEADPVRSQRPATQRVSGRPIIEHIITWSWLEI
jgi:hypothetical protein